MSAGRKHFGAILALLIGVPHLLGGLALMAWAAHLWVLYYSTASWQATPATVQSVELVSDTGSERPVYGVRARYEYTVAGRLYKGDRVDIMGGSSSDYGLHAGRYEQLEEARKGGRAVTAWVDPNAPARSVLYREQDPWMYGLTGLGILFTMSGSGLLTLVIVMARRGRKLAKIAAHDGNRIWHMRADWAVGRVRPSSVRTIVTWWAMGIGLSVFFASFLIMAGPDEASPSARILIRLFCLIPVYMLLRAAGLTLRQVAQGTPVLYLSEVPVVPGRSVVGAVRTHRPLRAGHRKLSLQCYVPSLTDDSTSERMDRVADQLRSATGQYRPGITNTWRGKCACTLDLEPAGDAKEDTAAQSMLPISIKVPAAAPGTSLDPAFEVTWVLAVKARSFPLSFFAAFDLPVFYAEPAEIRRTTGNDQADHHDTASKT